MTAGFLLFGAGMTVFSVALRRTLGRATALAAVAAGVCTIAVAAVPLDAGYDGLHGTLAGAGYAALVAVPATAVRPLGRQGTVAATVALTATICLLVSVIVEGPVGLFQRLGLTLVDGWIVVTAVGLVRRRPRTVPP